MLALFMVVVTPQPIKTGSGYCVKAAKSTLTNKGRSYQRITKLLAKLGQWENNT